MRAFFPMPRYGHVTSNIAESTYAWLLECRKRSPTKLFMKAIQKINARFAERREMNTAQDETAIVDWVLTEIVKNNENGRRLEARRVSGPVFDVQSRVGSEASRVVNLETRECSCMKFQDLGFPCKHACAAAILAGVDIPSL